MSLYLQDMVLMELDISQLYNIREVNFFSTFLVAQLQGVQVHIEFFISSMVYTLLQGPR